MLDAFAYADIWSSWLYRGFQILEETNGESWDHFKLTHYGKFPLVVLKTHHAL